MKRKREVIPLLEVKMVYLLLVLWLQKSQAWWVSQPVWPSSSTSFPNKRTRTEE